MKDLIQIQTQQIGTDNVNSVNSRDIYEYLEVKTVYANWIQRAIEKYDFVENVDYIKISPFSKNGNREVSGFKEREDYIVTLDMAKELCMVSNTAKGKETRKYFIECEKRLTQTKPLSYEELMRNALYLADSKVKELQIENKTLNNVLEEQKPKVAFANSVSSSNDSILIGAFAKAISTEEFTIGQNRLFEYLRDKGYLISFGQAYNQPLQKYIDNGYFEVSQRTINNPNGTIKLVLTTKITGKGQVALYKKLKEEYKLQTERV